MEIWVNIDDEGLLAFESELEANRLAIDGTQRTAVKFIEVIE